MQDRKAQARAVRAKKNAYYAELVFSGAIPLRQGVMALMEDLESWWLLTQRAPQSEP